MFFCLSKLTYLLQPKTQLPSDKGSDSDFPALAFNATMNTFIKLAIVSKALKNDIPRSHLLLQETS